MQSEELVNDFMRLKKKYNLEQEEINIGQSNISFSSQSLEENKNDKIFKFLYQIYFENFEVSLTARKPISKWKRRKKNT
jgi:hypothetical protein